MNYKEWDKNLLDKGKVRLTPEQASKFGIRLPEGADWIIVAIEDLKKIEMKQ